MHMFDVKTRTRLWFVLALVLGVVAVIALHGTAQAIVEVAAVGVFFAAAIRYVGLAVRDDPTRSQVLGRSGLLGGVAGGLASLTANEERLRRRRDSAAPDADSEPLDDESGR